MKKVGVVSLYYGSRNCGGLLQAYAMCSVLKLLGYDAQQICFDRNIAVSDLNTRINLKLNSEGLTGLVKSIFRKTKSRLFYSKELHADLKKAIEVFSPFEKAVPHSDKVFTVENISDCANDYDIYVAGSDQIWNWAFNYNDAFEMDPQKVSWPYRQSLDGNFLRFVPDGVKKIAYAASIACPEIPDKLKVYYHDSLERFDALSLRERDSLKLLPDDIRDRTVAVVDPTMLLSADDWTRVLKLGSGDGKKYIFCYLLSPRRDDVAFAKKVSSLLGLPLVYNPTINVRDKLYYYNWGGIEDSNMGPREFVEYIKNASLVLTNSFHATIFSIQFNTPFNVMKRESKVSMHSRMTSVLEDYHLEGRLCERPEDAGKDTIDWNNVNAILEKNREESKAWLVSALKEGEL